MTDRHVRSRYIVDWGLQGNLLAHGLLYGGLSLLALTAGIFAPLLWNLGGGGLVTEFEEQAVVMLYMHERFWLPALVCMTIACSTNDSAPNPMNAPNLPCMACSGLADFARLAITSACMSERNRTEARPGSRRRASAK